MGLISLVGYASKVSKHWGRSRLENVGYVMRASERNVKGYNYQCMFIITKKALNGAGLKKGDMVDILLDAEDKSCVIRRCEVGMPGKHLNMQGKNSYVRIRAIPDIGLPVIKTVSEPIGKVIVAPSSIAFKLDFGEDVIYYTKENDGRLGIGDKEVIPIEEEVVSV